MTSRAASFAAVLAAAVLAVPALALAVAPRPSDAPATSEEPPRWPGHRPGKVVLGMACGGSCAARERELGRSYGVRRSYVRWGQWAKLVQNARTDQGQGRLPWISVKGPEGGTPAGWRALRAGRYDAAIRGLAANLEKVSAEPLVLTFQHEPSNDGTELDGRDWAAAYVRFQRVLDGQGALANVALVPILQYWLFNPRNRRQAPANWVTGPVLRRSSFLGLDVYQEPGGETLAQRVPRVRRWLAAHGYPDMMVGIGEMGATDRAYPRKNAAQWIDESMAWAVRNPGAVGVVAYFNTELNPLPGRYWPLNESASKLAAFRRWLDDPRVVS